MKQGGGSKSGKRPKTYFRKKKKGKLRHNVWDPGCILQCAAVFFPLLSLSKRAKATEEANGARQLADGALTYFGMSHSSPSC